VSTLHITNGDEVANKLRIVFPGPVSIMADPLHEGPAAELDGASWRNQRAEYLAAAGYTTVDDARSALDAWDHAIDRAGDHEDVVLWFEHDLFDQLALVRTLALLDALRGAARPRRVSLICVNAFLGYLPATELHALWPTRAPVTDAQYAIARHVWHAFRQPDPTDLLRARDQLQTDRAYCQPMPFLGDALERFFEEFPSTTTGLPRTADALLQVLADAPGLTGAELFRRIQAREDRMFLGDLGFFQIIGGLARARVPLVAAVDPESPGGASDPGSQLLSITDAGGAVLRRAGDAVRLNGIEVWRGGVHLSGDQAGWRWDPQRKTLISWS
jgi:hypothetical protein